jgi:hypothetical protein
MKTEGHTGLPSCCEACKQFLINFKGYKEPEKEMYDLPVPVTIVKHDKTPRR